MLNAIDEAAGLWEVCTELKLPAALRLPLRMTVVRLPDGGLWLHSPIPIDDALAAQLAALGPVRHLLAPSKAHYFYLAAAKARFPQARVYAAPGLAAKHPELPIDETLHAGSAAAWGGALDACASEGAPYINETVFLHRASGTLICADLVFNLVRPLNAATGLYLRLFGTRGRFAVSRIWHLFVRDRRAFAASLEGLRGWEFRRILMGHGEVYESERAREDLFAAMELRFGKGPTAPADGSR